MKFVAKIYIRGEHRRAIEIPSDLRKEADKMIGKQLKITVEELKL